MNKDLYSMHTNSVQRVFTPQSILDVPTTLWGQIEYDAAGGDVGYVLNFVGRAAAKRDELPEDPIAANLATRVESLVRAKRSTTTRGLDDPWPDKTWCNPEYKNLRVWLEMSMRQPSEHMMLVPVRPNRKWWRAWARQLGTTIVYLNPVTFVGHDAALAVPLCLALVGVSNRQLATFVDLCQRLELGEPL